MVLTPRNHLPLPLFSQMSSLELQQAKDRVKQAHYKDGLEGRRLKTFYTTTCY